MANKQNREFAIAVFAGMGAEQTCHTSTMAFDGTAEQLALQFASLLSGNKFAVLKSPTSFNDSIVVRSDDVVLVNIRLLEKAKGQADHED